MNKQHSRSRSFADDGDAAAGRGGNSSTGATAGGATGVSFGTSGTDKKNKSQRALHRGSVGLDGAFMIEDYSDKPPPYMNMGERIALLVGIIISLVLLIIQ